MFSLKITNAFGMLSFSNNLNRHIEILLENTNNFFSKMGQMKIDLLLSGRVNRLYTIKGNNYKEESYINNLKYAIINDISVE